MSDSEARVPRLEAAPDNREHRGPALPAAASGTAEPAELDLDPDRVDAAVLAVLLLTAHRQGKTDAWRSWKNVSWEATDRLYEKGYISDPKSKAKSVMLTHAGLERGRELLRALCGRDGG